MSSLTSSARSDPLGYFLRQQIQKAWEQETREPEPEPEPSVPAPAENEIELKDFVDSVLEQEPLLMKPE